jgi:hypothetical protein
MKYTKLPRKKGKARIFVGFFDQILRVGPLVVEPHQQVDGMIPAGDEDTIGVVGCVE